MVSFTAIIAALMVSVTLASPVTVESSEGVSRSINVARGMQRRQMTGKPCPAGEIRVGNGNGKKACVSLTSSPTNCGSLGNVCVSYNGLGKAICVNGQCDIVCNPGQQKKAANGSGLSFCA